MFLLENQTVPMVNELITCENVTLVTIINKCHEVLSFNALQVNLVFLYENVTLVIVGVKV